MKVRATNDFRLSTIKRLSTIPERTATPASLLRDFCVVFETIFTGFSLVHLFYERPFGCTPGGVAACPGDWCSRSGGGYTHGTRAAVAGVCGSDFYRVEVRRLVFLFWLIYPRSGSGWFLCFFLLYAVYTLSCLCRFLLYGIKARRRGGWCSVFVEKTNKEKKTRKRVKIFIKSIDTDTETCYITITDTETCSQ